MPLVWILEGIVVGFGAILPGISGGTLCVAFGMYRPLIETISHPFKSIKKYGVMFCTFMVGIAVGFMGLSGIAAYLLDKNTTLVTCAFIGFIIGTFPELWRDAGQEGRSKASYASTALCFIAMIFALSLLKTSLDITVAADFAGFILCGVLWGLSFIVPGLSSSSLLLFFGLYGPMLEGISRFDLAVLIPMAIGMGACVLALSKAVNLAYKKFYSVISHGVLGIVAATAVMIMPQWDGTAGSAVASIIFVIIGACVSYAFSCICDRIKEKSEH